MFLTVFDEEHSTIYESGDVNSMHAFMVRISHLRSLMHILKAIT